MLGLSDNCTRTFVMVVAMHVCYCLLPSDYVLLCTCTAEFLKSQISEQDIITSSNVTAVAQAQSNLRLDPALCAAVNSQVLAHQPQPADGHSLQPHEMFSLEIGAPKVPSAIAQRITKRI